MNYIKQLNSFFDVVAKEKGLNPSHVSLYISLFHFWNLNRFNNPICVSRSEIRRISMISSNATYHKVLTDLTDLGLIQYEPSYNPFRGSEIYMNNLDTGDFKSIHNRAKKRTGVVQVLDQHPTKKQQGIKQEGNSYHTKNQQGTVLLNEPIYGINSINILNNKLAKQQAPESTSLNFEESQGEQSPVAGEDLDAGYSLAEALAQAGPRQVTDFLAEIKSYFTSQKSSPHEAEKFFNYFQSNGWKVGGKAPMKDWQAAARNWILNSRKFNSHSPGQNKLPSTKDIDYSEPL